MLRPKIARTKNMRVHAHREREAHTTQSQAQSQVRTNPDHLDTNQNVQTGHTRNTETLTCDEVVHRCDVCLLWLHSEQSDCYFAH